MTACSPKCISTERLVNDMNTRQLFSILFVAMLFFVLSSNGFASSRSVRQDLVRANSELRQGDEWSSRMILLRVVRSLPKREGALIDRLNRVVVLIQRDDELAARVRLQSIIRSL